MILDRGVRIEYKAAARRRRKANAFMRAWIRCKGMADGYDTDEETTSQSGHVDADVGVKTPPAMPAGLVPLDYGEEVNDHGEESYYRAKMLTRALRRLDRWENGKAGASERTRGDRYGPDLDESDASDEDMQDIDELERREDMDSDEELDDIEAEYAPQGSAATRAR